MKKWTCIILAVLLCFGWSLAAGATEATSCVVSVETVSATPGGTVTVAVSISQNPGFTNFAIALDYDREHLTLKSIQIGSDDQRYLCGTLVSVNPEWAEGEGNSLGFVVAASADPMKENGILFTATFDVKAGFTGEAEIIPVVRYIRNNEALFSAFREIPAVTGSGVVVSSLPGDVNGDGLVEYNDVMLAYRAFLGEAELTPVQMAMVDRNRNGIVEESEYTAIYEIYIGG